MQSDVKSSKHFAREIGGFLGLNTAAEDSRHLPDQFQGTAHNIMFDAEGDARPKDGSAQWWAPISQRVYLAEMEPGEDATWTNGAVSTTAAFGAQSRVINATGPTNMDRALPSSLDLLLAGDYTAALASINLSVRAATPADNTSVVLYVSSGAGFAANTRSWDITADVAALSANVWTTITKTLSSGVDIGGAPDFTAITRIRITVAQTAGSNVFFDEIYTSYSTYQKSFATGGFEFRKLSDSKRYTLAGFGDTVFADLNEAKAPYKIKSGLTRNAPLTFDVAEDRAFGFNGLDMPFVFTGSAVRNMGFPAPSAWTPGFTYGAGGSMTATGVYYYGVTFVYGEGSVKHGQSSMYESSTAATLPGGDGTCNLANLPVGGNGSGVIARRIYRCRANAGPLATKFFVAEIADNTTTTYADTLADSTLVLNDAGPLNNGVPTAAIRFGVWFQKAMVFLEDDLIRWSRPGTNLDESVEIIPAENVFLAAQAGVLMGAIEFNGNLYVFGRHGIVGKLSWNGGTLDLLPVQRTNESRAESIGLADGRAITIVQDRYIRWMGSDGRIWKMLPNEEVFPESAQVANITDDFNRLLRSSVLDYHVVDSEAQFEAGTVGSNLDTNTNSGRVEYGMASNVTSLGSSVVPSSTAFTNQYTSNAGPQNFYDLTPGGGPITRNLYFKLSPPPGQAMRVDKLYVPAGLYTGSSFTGSFTVQAYAMRPKYEDATPALRASNAVSIMSTNQVNNNHSGTPNSLEQFTSTLTFSTPVYVPANEYLIVLVQIAGQVGAQFGGTNQARIYLNGSSTTQLGSSGATIDYVTANASYGVFGTAHYMGADILVYDTAPVETSTITFSAQLQRYLKFHAPSITLRGGKRILVEAQYSSSGTAGTFAVPQVGSTSVAAWEPVYSRDWVADNGSGYGTDPTYAETYYFPAPPDYRVGQPWPAGTQFRYVRFRITFDMAGLPAPATQAASRISSVSYAEALPEVQDPGFYFSKEASFTTYNKANYANDIWTSEIIATAGIATFGRLYADYAENQQNVFFQVRTATSSGGITAASWADVIPGQVVGSTGLVASATHFQYRIIFQDDPNRNTGAPSYVNEVRWSWAITGAELAPNTPPVLHHYKDYTFVSWPSFGSRVSDRSMAISDHHRAYADQPQRWSTFGAPHYACYFVVGGKLVGGPVTGGVLTQLRDSAVTEYTGQRVVASFESLPINCGTMFLKTLHWLYIGLVLNAHRRGQFLAELGDYPSVSPTPTFRWWVSGNRVPSGVNFGVPPTPDTLYAFGQQGGAAEDFRQVLSHAASGAVLLAFPTVKPYQAEYGFDVGVQERAFRFGASWSPYLANGIAVFPTLTNFGFEGFIENYRGV